MQKSLFDVRRFLLVLVEAVLPGWVNTSVLINLKVQQILPQWLLLLWVCISWSSLFFHLRQEATYSKNFLDMECVI